MNLFFLARQISKKVPMLLNKVIRMGTVMSRWDKRPRMERAGQGRTMIGTRKDEEGLGKRLSLSRGAQKPHQHQR